MARFMRNNPYVTACGCQAAPRSNMVPITSPRLRRVCRSVPGHHGADAPKPERKKSLTKGEQLISERQKSNGEAKLRRKKSGDGERRKSSRDVEGERKSSVDEAENGELENGELEDSTPRPQQSGGAGLVVIRL